MSFRGPRILKGQGNSGAQPANKERVMALIVGGVAGTGIALNEPKRLVAKEQAEELGIDASYDANNSLLCYDDIVECFRLADVAEVILMITERPDGTTGNDLTNWFDADGPVETLLRSDIGRDVKFVFTRFNPTSGITATFANSGIADQVRDCFAPAQQLITRFYEENRFVDGIELDGWKMDTVAGLEDIRDQNAPDVSINISVDGYIHANYPSYPSITAVGAAMGMYGIRQINEDRGSVEVTNPPPAKAGEESYPLGNGTRWPKALLLDGTNLSTLTDTIKDDITAKGYIYAGSFADYDGFYFNGDPTAVDVSSDYAWIKNNCVFNAAARLIRAACIPKMRAVLKKVAETGFLKGTTVAHLEGRAQKKLNTLLERDLVSGAKVTINPEQTPDADTPLVASVEIVMDGTLYRFDVNLGLFNQLSA